MSDAGKIVDGLTKKFTDEGKLIEAGFQAYRMLAIPPNAPEIQVSECRLAYFFGAQHLFSSLMGVLDEGSEPTEDDLKRLDLIDTELNTFVAQVKEQMNG